MTKLENLTLGLTLFHSLWQGAIVALALFFALNFIRSSRIRYACACMAMVTIVAAFAMTLWLEKPATPGAESPRVHVIPKAPPAGGLDLSGIVANFNAADVLPWFAPFWIAGVIVFHLRGAAGWMAARRLRRRGVCCAPDEWQKRVRGLAEKLRVSKPVVLLETCLGDVPVVIGYLRPVILVPVGMLTAMPAAAIEAILLHELAHIRRRDYLVNVLQTIAESFLFYHPAVWWISGVIRAERENCCDDLVVATSGRAREYAATLAALEQDRWVQNRAALAANGGSLVKRIRRLLYPLESPRTVLTPALSAGILTIVAALALTAWQAAPAPPQTPAADAWTKWLNEDVVYIITDAERKAARELKTDHEHEMFIEQFWQRRGEARKEEHYRRIAFANLRFPSRVPGWKTDRGRIYITYGPPDEIDSHPSAARPFEDWRYRHIDGVGNDIKIEFVDTSGTGEYRMTSDPNPSTGTRVDPVLFQHVFWFYSLIAALLK